MNANPWAAWPTCTISPSAFQTASSQEALHVNKPNDGISEYKAGEWIKDRLCGLGLEDFRPDGIAIYTSLQLAVLDEFSDVTYTISGRALTDNEVTPSSPRFTPLVFGDISDNEQIRQAAHLHRCMDELSSDKHLGMTITRPSNTLM